MKKHYISSWIIDSAIHLIIAVFSLGVFTWGLFTALSNFVLFGAILTIIGAISLFYSGLKAWDKFTYNKDQLDAFEANAEIVFVKCRKMASAYHPVSDALEDKVEEKVITAYLSEWKKHGMIKPFEYKLLDSYLNNFVATQALDDSEKLFLKFRLTTSDFTSHFAEFVSEVKNADYFTNGTTHNRFIKKIYLFSRHEKITTDIDSFDLKSEQIQETISYGLRVSNPFFEKFIQEKQNREKLEYLMAKCYENGYSNIGDLDKDLADKGKNEITFLLKYDERFTIYKKKWEKAIRAYFGDKYANASDLESKVSAQITKYKKILEGLPFYRALKDFDNCFEQVGRVDQLFVVHKENFGAEAKTWSVEKFLARKIIPKAKRHLEILNKELVKEFPFLSKLLKKTVNANYYLFHVKRSKFESYAEYESIPPAIRNLIIEKIMDSDNAANHVASQLIYIKQVISKMSLSGLLFTEPKEIQETILKAERKILSASKKDQLELGSIYDIASIGNKLDVLIAIIYKNFYGVMPKRKNGKNYKHAKRISEAIVSNAKDLLRVFNSLTASPER